MPSENLSQPGPILIVTEMVCSLLSAALYQFSQRRFIVRRYEELALDRLRYFGHPVFVAMSHPSWRTWFFTGHLALMMVIPYSLMRGNPFFEDIERREEVLRHFSRWQKASTAGTVFGGLFGFVVGTVGLVLRQLR